MVLVRVAGCPDNEKVPTEATMLVAVGTKTASTPVGVAAVGLTGFPYLVPKPLEVHGYA